MNGKFQQPNSKKYVDTISPSSEEFLSKIVISNEKDVKKYVSVGADAVIVGSANIKIMENTPKSKLEDKIFLFTKKLKMQTK